MVSSASEGVDFKFLKKILRNLGEKPIYDHAALNGSLRVEDKHHSCHIRFVQCPFEDAVGGTNVSSGVIESALNQTFEEVKN